MTLHEDTVFRFRVMATTFGLAIGSLACRIALAASAGRSTIVFSVRDGLLLVVSGGLIVALGRYMRSGVISTLGFGVGILSITFMYLPDATEAAVHLGRGFAYADAYLATIDKALAFDWAAYALWLDKHACLWTLGRHAYLSMPFIPLAVIVVLSLESSTERLATYFVANTVSLSACAGIVVFVPALGAYDHFAAATLPFEHHDFVTAAHMTRSLDWLRQADLLGEGVTYHGLVSFPSYHAMACVLDAWALWRSRYARWPMAALALLILIVTPVQGSHYLIDIVAGIGIAILAIRPSAWLVTTLSKRRQAGGVLPELVPA